MLQRTRPYHEKYLRYVLSWLIFGFFGLIFLWQWGWIYGLLSLAAAFILSFGLDLVFRFVVRRKVKAMVGEEPKVIVDAIRMRKERKGFLVVTDRFVLFVPLFRKIKTVMEADQIVRTQTDRLLVEITAKFPNRYRTFSYTVLSKKKLMPVLKELTGESLPYKYEKLEKLAQYSKQ
ncbi:hypothetical protein [Evansella clarkii]|jgi:hypothetical protein|uniref:hypothetical protein n=1 Tax=Evansella clarkii TaxID=79879 RepID=UPI0009961648|nr:hypothetical protein [Evansella clarkii]